jgi:putative transposase
MGGAQVEGMARKLRLEYAGAMYHVINRGNYRADIFASDGAKEAFIACLFDACAKAKWRLHAYVIMRNHYHLALETPEANLIAGMTWLQSTYANRFNRFRKENGHVFQGRYRAPVVENLAVLGAVGHYVHLNPVRAKFRTVENLDEYPFCSLHYLQKPKARPAGLTFEAVLSAAGGLDDSRAGWKSYLAYLDWLNENEPARRGLAFEKMSRGWALGSQEFRHGLLQEHAERLAGKALDAEVQKELRPQQWRKALEAGLRRLGKTQPQAKSEPKGAPWKVALAAHLKTTTTVSNPWLAEALHMGAPGAMSRYVTEHRAGRRPEAKRWHAKISKG